MTILELQILLDLNKGNVVDVLDSNTAHYNDDYVFVDGEDGQCYLFDSHGKALDIKKLRCINSKMFYEDNELKRIVIPDNVTRIGNKAFDGCTNLTNVTISNGVTSIDDYAFSNCNSLTSVTIPDHVTSIGPYAFLGCIKLTSMTIPNSVTTIEEGGVLLVHQSYKRDDWQWHYTH